MDREGFTLVQRQPLPTGGEEAFQDDARVKAEYYPLMEEAVRKALESEAQPKKVAKVIVFDHTLRTSEVQKLNVLGESTAQAGAVVRVHCDYTAESAPLRLRQLAKTGSYTGAKLDSAEVDELLASGRRFAFINVWRSLDEQNPVQTKPLAVCDYASLQPSEEFLLYELVYKERVGENYSLAARQGHRWYYYSGMRYDECLVFKVYDRRADKAPFAFHTAFQDENQPANAVPRRSVEARCVVIFEDDIAESGSLVRPESTAELFPTYNDAPALVFYDMAHSNTAARVRLWLNCKGVPRTMVQRKMLTHADIASEHYGKVNPLRKSPAMLTWTKGQRRGTGGPYSRAAVVKEGMNTLGGTGTDMFAGFGDDELASLPSLVRETPAYMALFSKFALAEANAVYQPLPLFESHVILEYVVSKFSRRVNPELGSFSFGVDVGSHGEDAPAVTRPQLYARQCLLQRVHDIYLSSSSCSQPGFSDTQGSMYLPPTGADTKWCPAHRAMDSGSREAKLREIFQQLRWVDNELANCWADCGPEGKEMKPYMVGCQLSLADMTWMPTVAFMEYLLPRNFSWPCVVTSPDSPFPHVQRWYRFVCEEAHPTTFGSVRQEINRFWSDIDSLGEFDALRKIVRTEEPQRKWTYTKEDL
jgi:glutathione S-transferase